MKKPLSTVPTISANKFRWKNDGSGDADASDLGCKPGEYPGSKLFSNPNDSPAANYGFYVKGKTKSKLFIFVKVIEYHEDNFYFKYVSEDGNHILRVYND